MQIYVFEIKRNGERLDDHTRYGIQKVRRTFWSEWESVVYFIWKISVW